MTENELLSRQYFKEIFILNSLYKKLINFVEDDRQCRKAGYRSYYTNYWNNPYVLAKSYIITTTDFVNIDIYDGIRVDFIKHAKHEGLYSIQIDVKGLHYMSCLRRFYNDKKYSLNIMHDLRGKYFPLLTSNFYVSQSQELPFHSPLAALKHIKQEISAVDIPGFIKIERHGNNYRINTFDMEGLENANTLINAILTGEIHKDI